jgi:hypothetical protein
VFGGLPQYAIPGNAGFAPPPSVMPPGNFGPAYDPLGIGPVAGNGPPPGPMYPMPGPYGQQVYQPAPPTPSVAGGDLGYGNAPHWWAEGEYLLWFTKGQNVRYPLLTTSAPSDAGIVGAASTTVLVGDRPLGYNGMNGLRIGTGFFGDQDRRFGFQVYGFILERASNTQTFGTLDEGTPTTPSTAINTGTRQSGIPVLARPFVDVVTGAQSSIVLSGPNFGPSQVIVGTNTQTWGITPEGVWNVYRSQPGSKFSWSFDLTAGYRYLNVKEQLWVYSTTELNGFSALGTFQSGPFGIITQVISSGTGLAQANQAGVNLTVPARVSLADQYTAVNQFNGAVLGFKTDARYGMFTSSLFGKIAVGEMHERVTLNGVGSFNDPTGASGNLPGSSAVVGGLPGGGLGQFYGGVLVNAANIGTYVHDRFTYIPEVGLNFGIALTKGLTGYIGGNFLYFPNLVRPGNLVNPVTSSAAVPFSANYGQAGAPRGPAFTLVETDHWIGGLTCGLILKY